MSLSLKKTEIQLLGLSLAAHCDSFLYTHPLMLKKTSADNLFFTSLICLTVRSQFVVCAQTPCRTHYAL